MKWKCEPIPRPNDDTRAGGEAYRDARERRGESIDERAALYGVTSAEYARFEDGEALIIPDSQQLWQCDDGRVFYGDDPDEWDMS